MAHADVFVLPSVYEPHGIVVHEAMAAGTPVIASDVCGAAYDLVDAGVNGEIFRSGDAEDLRAKLLAVLGDAERARQLRVWMRFLLSIRCMTPHQLQAAQVLVAEVGGMIHAWAKKQRIAGQDGK